ncbi:MULTISPECIES: helix-turn-helix domain-containing protein [Cupriavidus]|nr:helix-turn-helix transcriptional regulator [Cupriavidus malaysiensis]
MLRKQRGWSQEKLALESGLARSYVSGIERGVRNVALINICALADTLGVPPGELMRFGEAPASELLLEQKRTPFRSGKNPAQQATLRYMTTLSDSEQDVVAAVARALANKGGAR